MWDDLERVPWHLLRHNYGAARDVPGLLRRCLDDESGAAIDELDNLLFHQGGHICSAAPAALPYLLDLAGGAAAHHRVAVVELITLLVNEASRVKQRLVDPEWPAAAERELPRMLALLDDHDPAVRRAATLLVSCGGLPFEPVSAALWERWRLEDDRVIRWDLVLAFGDVLAEHPGAADVRDLLHSLLDADPQLALAAVHALARSEPDLPPRHVTRAVAAIRSDDAADWLRSAWLGGSRQVLVNATGRLLSGDPAAATGFALAVADGSGRDERIAALQQAADVLAGWRAVAPVLRDFLVERLSDDEGEVRFRAAYLLGCLPEPSAADRLAELAGDPREGRAGDAAVWALARLGDERCLPAIEQRLTGPHPGFGWQPAHADVHFLLPSFEEVLGPLRAYADRLLPHLFPVVAEPNALCRLLGAWGAASAPAVPWLRSQLSRGDVVGGSAAQALGDIGPAAAEAADDLRHHAAVPSAAWAHWRVTGDPSIALPSLVGRLDAVPRHRVLRELGDLGAPASAAAARVAVLAGSAEEWVRTEAAYAHHRITGDPARAVEVLTEVAGALTEGRCRPVTIVALEHLAAIGAPAAAPIARAVLDSPRRLAGSGGWRVFTDDERLRAVARRTLREPDGPPARP